MANREEGLDLEHANIALKELATLHALSWCYKVKNGIDKLTSVFPSMIDVMYNDNFADQFKPLMDHVQSSSLTFIEEAVGADSPVFLGCKKFFSLDPIELLRSFINVNGVDEEFVNKVIRIPNDVPQDYNTGFYI